MLLSTGLVAIARLLLSVWTVIAGQSILDGPVGGYL